MTRVLVVEEEPQLVRDLVLALRNREYEVDAAPDGASAVRLAAVRRPDVVLLDSGLPDMDGVEVIRALREWTGSIRVEVLVISARRESEEKVRVLDAGADDYVTKPFGMDELLARLRAAARRAAARRADARRTPGAAAWEVAGASALVVAGDVTIDLVAKKARREGRPVRLSPTEWRLLETLIRSSGRAVPYERLLQEVWGPGHRTRTDCLRVHITYLRRKLEQDPRHPRHLLNEPRRGYRFEQT
ncbi:response regulator [Streptomyces albiaxialis]|uniref:Response regulator n=1 Tax=Streptomyces albiaxialis TaxID=329523 RepID=A0ABN2VNF8_9ACTN